MKKVLFIGFLLLAANKSVFAFDEERSLTKSTLASQVNPEKAVTQADQLNILPEDAQSEAQIVPNNDMNKGVAVFPNLNNVLCNFNGVSDNVKHYISNNCKELFATLLKFTLASEISVNVKNEIQQNKNQNASEQRYITQRISIGNNSNNKASSNVKVKYYARIGNASINLFNVDKNITCDISIDEQRQESLDELKKVLEIANKDVQNSSNAFCIQGTFFDMLDCMPCCWFPDFLMYH